MPLTMQRHRLSEFDPFSLPSLGPLKETVRRRERESAKETVKAIENSKVDDVLRPGRPPQDGMQNVSESESEW